jgi:hypothetical protein
VSVISRRLDRQCFTRDDSSVDAEPPEAKDIGFLMRGFLAARCSIDWLPDDFPSMEDLQMRLPFTIDQFLDVFSRYNVAVWPAQWGLAAAAVGAAVLAVRDRPNDHHVVSLILALLWLWMAAAYHLGFFVAVNPVAIAFGAAFAIQGVLFAWLAFRGPRASYRPRSPAAAVIGAVFMLYALVLYPALGYVLGHRYPAAPTFGVPCPTTIFTLGLVVWASESVPRWLLVVPLAWSAVATSAAVNLGMMEDFGLSAAAVVSVGWLVFGWRRPSTQRGAVIA